MTFYVGLHMPSHAHLFEHCCISINRLLTRQSNFAVRNWILDSGAFTAVSKYRDHQLSVEEYAKHIKRWRACGNLLAAVSQDYMCEPAVLKKTRRTVRDHQRLTTERYRALRFLARRSYIMPVLQGWVPADYVRHLKQYGRRLHRGAWVGVGSVCRRNGKPAEVEDVLLAIARTRPDLRLHGFGLKLTALRSPIVRDLLTSSDSMAWSWNARWQGRSPNDPGEARRYVERVKSVLHS